MYVFHNINHFFSFLAPFANRGFAQPTMTIEWEKIYCECVSRLTFPVILRFERVRSLTRTMANEWEGKRVYIHIHIPNRRIIAIGMDLSYVTYACTFPLRFRLSGAFLRSLVLEMKMECVLRSTTMFPCERTIFGWRKKYIYRFRGIQAE